MKSKIKTLYICSNCGYQTPKWLGKCPSCGEWNTLEEEVISQDKKEKDIKLDTQKITSVSKITSAKFERIKSNINEFDRVMGGGTVPGSVVLIGGEPGIGKSTLLLQVSDKFASKGKVLYISGEESPGQIKLRAERLNIKNENIFILPETDINIIISYINSIKPVCVIVDSIQTINNPDLYTVTGSISQIRDTTTELLKIAKKHKIPIFLIGHITKEGSIAGPKALEHIVDVVLYMEGERYHSFRLLRSYKNRFGSTYEIGVFEMTEDGLVEVNNPSSYFLEEYEKKMPGSVIVTIMEGTRPILIELQSLVVPTNMPYPRRIVEGTDYNKVLLIAAVLEKLVGVNLSNQEIYVKVVGGMKIKEPAVDLGIAVAILSSFKNKHIRNGTVFIGEIGLTGEIRPVTYINQRIQEAIKIGFKNIVIPYGNQQKLNKKIIENIKISHIRYINEIFNYI